MLQTSFDHLTLQLIGVLLNGWFHHEFMIPRSIGFDLLPNVFVIANEPFVGISSTLMISNSVALSHCGAALRRASVCYVGNRTFAEQECGSGEVGFMDKSHIFRSSKYR
jgi:hypothetical protein